MRTYYIYMGTNKINGKSYIGQTTNPKRRIREHLNRRCASGYRTTFQKDIDKYGKDNFEWKVLSKHHSKSEADKEETQQILKRKTLAPNGYNSLVGGGGGSTWRSMPVVCLTFDGKFVKRYESASDAESDGFTSGSVLRSCRDATSWTRGHIFMFESDYKKYGGRRKADRGVPNFAKEIYQCDMDGRLIKKFRMVADAEKELGIRHSGIISCARGKYKSAGGYIFVYPEDYPIKNIETHRKKVKGRKIAKVDAKTGEILATYDRTTDAARELGGNYKCIHKVLDEPQKTAYGFRWISQ